MTVETIRVKEDHVINGENIYIKPYGAFPVYTKLSAELDPASASILEADQEFRDELELCEGLEIKRKDGAIKSLTGDWFQLEWVWEKIDGFTRHQSRIQNKIQRTFSRSISSEQALGDQTKSPLLGTTESKRGIEDRPPASAHNDDNGVKMSNPQMYKGGANHSATIRAQMRDGDERDKVSKGQTQTFKLDFQKDGTETSKASVHCQTDHKSNTSHPLKSTTKSLTNSVLNESGENAVVGSEIEIMGKTDTVLSLDFKYGGLKVSVYVGMITMEETDVIVNAAMGPLVNGGGVAWAIASNASPQLQEQCDDYVKKYGSVRTSGVMHTVAGGNLSSNVKHVIHAVGPVWDVLNQDDKCMRQLTMTFLNALKYGNEELRVASISFPLISSGIFGCPVEVCTRSFLYAILLFGSQYPDAGLKEIHLVNNDENNTGLTVASLRDMIQQGSVHLLDKARRIDREFDGIETVVRVAGQKLALDERTTRDDLPSLSDTNRKGHTSVKTKLTTDVSKTVGYEPRPQPPPPNTIMSNKTDKKKK
ncbi:uncharacterized protein LOC127857200 [Dreissena polymorpha]|nr:uncharacterized protein LOC127857200 [Dreissena polymorpha]